LDHREQHIEVEGLLECPLDVGVPGRFASQSVMRRHDKDGEVGSVLMVGEVLEELEPTHPRHHQVEQDETRAGQRIQFAERVEAIGGCRDLAPLVA
jgi:hypothetical protein